MNDASFLKKIAALTYLSTDTSSKVNNLSKKLWCGALAFEAIQQLYEVTSNKKLIEEAQIATVLRIANFVKNNPRSSEAQKVAFIRDEISKFAKYVESL